MLVTRVCLMLFVNPLKSWVDCELHGLQDETFTSFYPNSENNPHTCIITVTCIYCIILFYTQMWSITTFFYTFQEGSSSFFFDSCTILSISSLVLSAPTFAQLFFRQDLGFF